MKKDILWNSIGTSAWSFLSLALLVVVTRINGIEASGAFSFAFAFALIMYTVSSYGGRVYQVSDQKNVFKNSSYLALRLFTSLAALFFTLLFIALNQYNLQLSVLIVILVSQRIFDALADVFHGILQRNNQLYVAGRSLFYKSFFSFVVFLILDLSTKNLLLSASCLPLISLLFLVLYDIPKSINIKNTSFKVTSSHIKTLFIATFLPFSISALGLVFANLARYFIELFHPELQGYFGIIIMPLSFVLLLFSFVTMPILVNLTKKYNSGEHYSIRQLIRRIVFLMTSITIVLCLATYAFATPVLNILFGINLSNYIFDIILVVIIGYMLSVSSLFATIAIIARKLRFPVFVYLFSIVVLSILCISLVQKFSIRGAVVSYAFASIIQLLALGAYYLRITTNYKLSKKS